MVLGSALVFAFLACTGADDEPSGSKQPFPDDSRSECAGRGCAAPPPCGQKCTDPCGCCPNLECELANSVDSGSEGGDASAEADAPSD